MKKTNVLNHSSKNWLLAFVAVCGFMFMGASSVSAQYVDAAEATSRIADYRIEQQKARQTGNHLTAVSFTDLTDEGNTEIYREMVAKNFLSELSGATSTDVANAIATLNSKFSGLPYSARKISLQSALNDLTGFLRN